jgi:hypothetical protein
VQVPRFTNNGSILAEWGGVNRTPPAYSTHGFAWTNSYVGVWHFNGIQAADSARDHDADIQGIPTVLGRIGNGAVFKRAYPDANESDAIRVTWSSDLDLGANYEVQCWFKVAPADKADYLVLTAKEAANDFNNRNWWLALNANGRLQWKSSGGIDIMTTVNYADGLWHHCAAVHEGSVARLYVDGIQAGTDTSPGSGSVQSAPVLIGEEWGAGAGRRFAGHLDELRLSNARRSSNWVWASYLTVASNSTFTTIGAVVSNTPPVLAAVSNRTIIAGATLFITNSAVDSDLPAQSLSYSLITSPGGASIHTSSGLITWRPRIAQAGSNYVFSVRVADNGPGNLTATENFSVTVVAPARPVTSNPRNISGRFQLICDGESGPDYTVQASTNLLDWVTVFTTNTPALPFQWTDPETTNVPGRFYRVLLEP